MERLIAMCGLICNDCEAYQATQADDVAQLERVVAHWREVYRNPSFNAANVACDGCTGAGTQHCSHCGDCGIRLCGQSRGVANCGVCSEYESCAKIQGFMQNVPGTKTVLDEVRAARM